MKKNINDIYTDTPGDAHIDDEQSIHTSTPLSWYLRDVFSQGLKNTLNLSQHHFSQRPIASKKHTSLIREADTPKKYAIPQKKTTPVTLTPPKVPKQKRVLFISDKHLMILAILFAIVVFIPGILWAAKTNIVHHVYKGYHALQDIPESGAPEKNLSIANKEFSRALFPIRIVYGASRIFGINNDTLSNAYHGVSGVKKISHSLEKILNEITKGVKKITDLQSNRLLKVATSMEKTLQKELPKMQEALQHLEKISNDGSPESQKIQATLPQGRLLLTFVENLLLSYDTWLDLLGATEPKTILVLNQNQDELRASGGFPGSALILKIYKGQVESWELRDIYAFDWNLVYEEASPEGINQFKETEGSHRPVNLGTRDANYYPTFEQSAQKINFLLEKSGFNNIDLIVGINQFLVIDILQATGPISMEKVPEDISSENFSALFSLMVESKQFGTTSPKEILGEFAAKFFQEISEGDVKKDVGKIFLQHLLQNEIIIASPNARIQTHINNLKVFDRWQYDDGDWIYPIFTSVSKNKSDRYMEREFHVYKNSAQPCQRTFVLQQTHGFGAQEEIMLQKLMYNLGIRENLETALFVQGNGENKQYIRLLLPKDVEILSEGANITHEDSYTQVEWYQDTPVLGTSLHEISYKVPQHLCNQPGYIYKQPGLRDTHIKLYENQNIVSHYYQ